MSTVNTTQITVTSSDTGLESEWSPHALSNSSGAAGGHVLTTLSSGDNTVSVPTGAKGMVMEPPAASTAVLRLKHYAGETGFALRAGEASAIPLPSGTSSVLVNSSAVAVIKLHWT